MKLSLEQAVKGIKPVSQEWRLKARDYLGHLAIPPGSLGELLRVAEQLAAIKETLKPSVTVKRVCTMAGDHGVVAEGVSAFPQEVTPQMVANFVKGGAGINVLSAVVGAKVVVVDVGVNADLSELAQAGHILDYKVDFGTKNMAVGPAMTREQAIQALEAGINVVRKLVEEEGVELLATGDMGIGNTTPSSAILAAMSNYSVEEVTGRGTGVDDHGLTNKVRVIKKALEVNKPDAKDALDVLAKVGGYEIGAIAGLILGAAYYRVPILVDGFISSAGALIAKGLSPESFDYMIGSHQSMEAGHKLMLETIGLKPLLNLNLRLGEGTGAALAMNIVEASAQVISKMLTFEAAGVTSNA